MTNLQDKKEDKDWIFMWGTAPILPSFWATPKAQKERPDIPTPGQTSFQYFDGESLTMYMKEEEIEETKENSYGQFDDEENYEEFVKNFEGEQEEWWSWIEEIRDRNYDSVGRNQLLEDYKKHTQLHRDALGYFGATRPEPNHAVEKKLQDILKEKEGDDWPDYFGLLTTPNELDDVQKQQLDLARLHEKDEVTDEELLEHARTFPWFVFGQFNEGKVIDYLRDSLKDYDGDSYDEAKRQQKEELEQVERKQSEYLNSLGENEEEARHLSRVLKEQSVRRMEIKSFWVGSYFLIRDFWHRLADELGRDVWDFLTYLMPPEVNAMLKGEFDRDIQEVMEKRKNHYAIVYEGGDEIEVLDGEEAQNAFESKIESEKKDVQKVEGQPAVLGEYEGRVRKVMPGDLEDLQEDINKFQDGEVLVTTMTQPNMVVMMKKAGAIVTDEGGITSHAAIVSRELDVPCIVGCLEAMEVFEDGDKVKVDANEGIVKLIEKA